MNRSTILACIAALALLLPANSAQTTFPGPNPPCNSIQNAPVVVWNVSGGTLLGLIQMNLVVYDSGLAVLSKRNELAVLDGGFDLDVDVRTASVTPQGARDLLGELRDAGAFTLCDQTTLFDDAPLNTLSVLRGLDDAKAHSASWFVGDVPFGGVETALYDFIQTEFPGF